MTSKWRIALTVALAVAMMGVPSGVAIWYTNWVVSNECASLGYLIQPQSQIQHRNPIFYHDLLSWYNRDRCG